VAEREKELFQWQQEMKGRLNRTAAVGEPITFESLERMRVQNESSMRWRGEQEVRW
jgi:hypothetical protein